MRRNVTKYQNKSSVLKINPKQIEKAYIQTICYNDDEGDGVNIDNQAGYTKVFGHDATDGGFFESYEAVGSKNPEDPDSKLYSILDQLEDFRNSEGKFHFKLCYPELTWGKDGKTCNEWIQSSNPYTDSTITGFEEIFLAFDNNGNKDFWKGLGKNTDVHIGGAYLDDSPFDAYWFSAIGARTNWLKSDHIPGPRHPNDLSEESAVTKVELYVKV